MQTPVQITASEDACFLAETSIFDSNYNTAESGSIIVSAEESVLDRICSINSCQYNKNPGHMGVFCYISASYSLQNAQNKIIESSISSSGQSSYEGVNNIYLTQGSPVLKSANVSYAEVYISCLFVFRGMQGNSNISYSSFVNNSDDKRNSNGAELYDNRDLNVTIEFCNFLNNTCSMVIVTFGPSVYISESSFFGNDCEVIGGLNHPREIIVSQCYIRDNVNLEYIRHPRNEFTVKLFHLSTALCEADFVRQIMKNGVLSCPDNHHPGVLSTINNVILFSPR